MQKWQLPEVHNKDLVSLLGICGLSPIIRNGLACNIFWLQVIFFCNAAQHTSLTTD